MNDTVYDAIYRELSKTGFAVCMDGDTVDGNPETYITYLKYDEEPLIYANNKPVDGVYSLRINLYSKDPAIHQQAESTIKNILIPAGFTKGHGRDLSKDKDTNYIGYTCDYEYYMEE